MYLLDTHLVLWLAYEPARLSAFAAGVLTDRNHIVAFSLTTIWEVAIKTSLRRPGFAVDPLRLRKGLLAQGFIELGLKPEHLARVAELPWHHRDPFDRLLVAQAQHERWLLLTSDKALSAYGPAVQSV